jgi:hypothetical protein
MMLRGRGGGRRVAAGIDDDEVRARTGGRDALDDLAGLDGKERQLGCLRPAASAGIRSLSPYFVTAAPCPE